MIITNKHINKLRFKFLYNLIFFDTLKVYFNQRVIINGENKNILIY